MESLDLNQRNRNGAIAIVAVAVIATALWAKLAYDCGYGVCDAPRLGTLQLALLIAAFAGWLAGSIFGLCALWDKAVARERLRWPASAGIVLFVCVTLQVAAWVS